MVAILISQSEMDIAWKVSVSARQIFVPFVLMIEKQTQQRQC